MNDLVLTKEDCHQRLSDEIAENCHTGIIGTSGSGKTEWLYQLTRQLHITIVFDTGNEFSNKSDFKHASSIEEIWEIWNKGYGRIAYTPTEKGNHLIELTAIIHQLYEIRNEKFPYRVNICVPEISHYALQGPTLHPEIQWLFKQGRKYGIDCIYDTQRIADTNKTIIQETAYFYIFQQFGKDLEAVIKMFPEIALLIKKLDTYEFLLWIPKSKKVTLYNKLPY